jgi:hypothetical protein
MKPLHKTKSKPGDGTMKALITILVISLCAMHTLTHAQGSPLKLTIESEKQVYGPGEKVHITAMLQNNQDKKIWVATIPRWGEDIIVEVTEVKAGERFESSVWKREKSHPILLKEYFHALGKDEFVKSSENILRWTEKLEPGTYEISAYYKIAPKRLKIDEGEVWTGRVDSNVFIIEIVDKNSKPLDSKLHESERSRP